MTPQEHAWLIAEFAVYLVLGAILLGTTLAGVIELFENSRAKRIARKFAAFKRG